MKVFGPSYMWGGAGNDTLDASASHYGAWRARLYGGVGRDVLKGGAGADLLSGGDHDDTIHGLGGHRDSLYGGAGDDYITDYGHGSLWGGAGDDTLDVSANSRGLAIQALWRKWADLLIGGDGRDVLSGGGFGHPQRRRRS